MEGSAEAQRHDDPAQTRAKNLEDYTPQLGRSEIRHQTYPPRIMNMFMLDPLLD